MADLLQSSATTATAAPTYYTDYLSNLASKGTAAGNAVNSAAWDPNALQQQSFSNVAANVGNYLPGLQTAGQTLSNAAATDITGAAQPYLQAGTTTGGLSQANPYLQAGTTTSGLSQANPYLQAGTQSAADLVGNYMNPYTKNVVDQIAKANQQNIAQNLSPGITAGAVGGGQFGSQRGANALSMGISNANLGALTQQATALQSGYSDAMKQAQQQLANQLTAGQTAGNLQNVSNANQVAAGTAAGNLQNAANQNQVAAGQVAGNAANQQGQLGVSAAQQQAAQAQQLQTQGLADTNALATVGQQQQTMAQNKQLMPLDVLGKQAAIMSGAQLPMTTTQTMTGSPLSAIASLGATAKGLLTPSVAGGKSVADQITEWLKGSAGAGATAGTTPVQDVQSTDPNYDPYDLQNVAVNNPVQDVQSTDPNYDSYDYQGGSQGI